MDKRLNSRVIRGILLWVVYLFLFCGFVFSTDASAKDQLLQLLPDASEAGNMKPDGEIQTAKGDNLFKLINGGAEIFFEYGFENAAFQSYQTASGKRINLELYEMKNADGAFGMYTFKSDACSDNLTIEDRGCSGDYSIMFQKGRVFAVLGGYDMDDETRSAMTTLARAVEKKIREKSKPPEIFALLSDRETKSPIRYVKGGIGLSKYFFFDPEPLLGFKEGITADYENFSVFLLRYADPATGLTSFNKSAKYFKKAEGFSLITANKKSFIAGQEDGKRIFMSVIESYVVIVYGDEKVDAAPLVEKIKGRILQVI